MSKAKGSICNDITQQIPVVNCEKSTFIWHAINIFTGVKKQVIDNFVLFPKNKMYE